MLIKVTNKHKLTLKLKRFEGEGTYRKIHKQKLLLKDLNRRFSEKKINLLLLKIKIYYNQNLFVFVRKGHIYMYLGGPLCFNILQRNYMAFIELIISDFMFFSFFTVFVLIRLFGTS